ncbi:MAG: permease [Gluconacetobacter diazotrophicus]|nr:permease [Gluconacetobacter diazotrophicus]
MSWFHFDPASFALSFLSVLFESVPFLLLGALISGLIEVFVPARWMTTFLPRRAGAAVAVSGLLGIVFPMCECGVVPVIRRLMKKGLPVSCAVTYLLASPVVNPIVAVSTFAAFRGSHPGPWTTTIYRVIFSYAVAVLAGLVVTRLKVEQFIAPAVLDTLPGRSTRRTAGFRIGSLAGAPVPALATAAAPFTLEGTEEGSGGPEALASLDVLEEGLTPTLGKRLVAALQRGTNDFLDVAVFVVIGAALASVFNTAVDQARVITPLATNPWAGVPALMLLAFVVAICSTSDAFIAATFTKFSFPARLAFLVFGPVFDLKLVFLYSLVFRRRFVLALGIGLFLLIALVCIRLSAS